MIAISSTSTSLLLYLELEVSIIHSGPLSIFIYFTFPDLQLLLACPSYGSIDNYFDNDIEDNIINPIPIKRRINKSYKIYLLTDYKTFE
jgi:hypothetical protein